MKSHPLFKTSTILASSILLQLTPVAEAQSITATLLDEETDIVNTSGTLVSAVHFQDNTQGSGASDPSPLVLNGIPHIVGSNNETKLTDNFGFEGDFRNGASGLPQDGSDIVQVLLSGIAGANGITMEIAGLEIGKTYLFQAYWEVDRNHTLTVTLEGETLGGIPEIQNQGEGTPGGTLISHTFTAGDDTYNAFFDRDDSVSGDPNNWLSGYSLQELEVVSTDVQITSISNVENDLWEITLQGGPETTYELRRSPELVFDPGTLIDGLAPGIPATGTISGTGDSLLTTDSEGQARVRLSLDDLRDFIIARIPEP